MHFFNEKVEISIKLSLNLVSKGSIGDNPALNQCLVVYWRKNVKIQVTNKKETEITWSVSFSDVMFAISCKYLESTCFTNNTHC